MHTKSTKQIKWAKKIKPHIIWHNIGQKTNTTKLIKTCPRHQANKQNKPDKIKINKSKKRHTYQQIVAPPQLLKRRYLFAIDQNYQQPTSSFSFFLQQKQKQKTGREENKRNSQDSKFGGRGGRGGDYIKRENKTKKLRLFLLFLC